MDLKGLTTSGGGRRALEGANLAVYTAVVVAIVALVNVGVNRYYNRRWDLTPNKKYTLSPQTLKLLRGLDRDVSIYNFDRGGGARERRDLLGEYKSASRHVTVKYIDPDRQPSIARQFAVRTYGTLVVAAGDRHFEAQDATESGITNAVLRVLKGQKTVYFIQGHGERDLESSERGGYEQIKKQLQNENYEAKTLVLLQKMEIPADGALVVVAGPRNDYLEPEAETLRKYVANGGRALLMLDPGVELPNLAKLLADWNVTLRNDLVIDENPVAQLFGTEPSMPLIVKYGSSPIVQPLARLATLFPLTRSFLIGKDYKAGLTDDSLCETSTASFGVADFNPKMQSVSFRAGKDYKGPLTIAVSGQVGNSEANSAPGGEKKTEGRFVALGTSTLVANAYLGFQGNRDLFMNMVNWLGAEEELISVRPKPPASQRLNMNAAQMNRIFYLGLIGLPLAILATGVSVWWQRR